MGKLKDYRKEGFPTDFKDVKTITQSIKDSNEKYTDINITEYFKRTFIRKNNLVGNKIHETVSKVDDDAIDSFLKEYFTIRELIQILIFII